MNNYPSDMLTRIRNGHRSKLQSIFLHPHMSNFCVKILTLLKKEGFIRAFL
jgi:ribosomal protein S8